MSSANAPIKPFCARAARAMVDAEDAKRSIGCPAPPSVIQSLDVIHGVRRSQKSDDDTAGK